MGGIEPAHERMQPSAAAHQPPERLRKPQRQAERRSKRKRRRERLRRLVFVHPSPAKVDQMKNRKKKVVVSSDFGRL